MCYYTLRLAVFQISKAKHRQGAAKQTHIHPSHCRYTNGKEGKKFSHTHYRALGPELIVDTGSQPTGD